MVSIPCQGIMYTHLGAGCLSLPGRLVVGGLLCLSSLSLRSASLLWISLVHLIPPPWDLCLHSFWLVSGLFYMTLLSGSSVPFVFSLSSSVTVTQLDFHCPQICQCLLFCTVQGLIVFSSVCVINIVFLLAESVLMLLSVLVCVSRVTVGWPLFSSVATSWESVAGLAGLVLPRRRQQQSILAKGRIMALYRPWRALSLTKQ